MDFLLILLILLAVITVVGHLIWVALAWFFRLLFNISAPSPPVQAWESCPGCRHSVPPGWQQCRNCGLLRSKAAELGELDVTARHLRRFVEAGILDESTGTRLQEECRASRQHLIRQETPVMLPEVVPAEPWRCLERLLADCADVRNLTLGNRRQAMAWCRDAKREDLAAMSLPAQLALAQLLHLEGETTQAIRMYRCLLESHPEADGVVEIALEAAEFAAQEGFPKPALWFLRRAQAWSLSAALQQRATQLERQLQPQEEILPVREVIPEAALAPVVQPPVRPGPHEESPAEGVALPAAAREQPPPIVPAPPRRGLGEVLAAFMEERNILWGELVGGLLIVGCSIALVISLWRTLEAIPYFPFLIFAGITAALFGIGFYTLHHWKLEASSRGLLAIALLLVPLDFLVLAGLAPGTTTSTWDLATAAGSLVVFAALVYCAGQVLFLGRRWLLTLAMLGPSAAGLLVQPLLADVPPPPFSLLILSCSPLVCYLLACSVDLLRAERGAPRGDAAARGLLAFLGLASFALAVALGFLAYRAARLELDLRFLAVPTAVAAVPLLVSGLWIYRGFSWLLSPGTEATLPEPSADELSATLRTIGTAVALGGLAILLGAAIPAWPWPRTLLALGLLDFAVLTGVALLYRLPLLQPIALVCLTGSYLIGYYLAVGNLGGITANPGSQLARLAYTPESGSALVVLVILAAGLSEVFVRYRKPLDAVYYVWTAGGLALASLVLVNLGGVAEPARAALTCGALAVAALTLNARWRQSRVGYGGLALGLLATLWGLQAYWPGPQPVWAPVVALESLGLAGVAVLVGEAGASARRSNFSELEQNAPTIAWRDVAAAASLLALGLAAISSDFPAGRQHAGTAAVLSVSSCLLACRYRLTQLSWLGSLLLLFAILHLLLQTFFGPALPLIWRSFLGPLFTYPWLTLVGLLFHATLALALGSLPIAGFPSLRHFLSTPLRQSGLLSTFLAVLLLPLTFDLYEVEILALYAFWLALLWVVTAWIERNPVLLSLGQVALAAAILLAVTVWLREQAWVDGHVSGLGDPRSLQVYGFGLAALSLGWVGVRIGLRGNSRACRLFNPPWPAVDCLLLDAVAVGQFACSAWALLPWILDELSPAGHVVPRVWSAWHSAAFGPAGWALLGTVALTLVVQLRDRPGAAVLGLILATLTVPLLAAGPFTTQHATASALRWGLGFCFLAVSIPLWLKGPLRRQASAFGITPAPNLDLTSWARRLLLAITVVPVLVLSVIIAVHGFTGYSTRGPDPSSFFTHVGRITSTLLPLVFVSTGLLGHGIRERLPGYTFAAGLIAVVTLMAWYALAVILAPGDLCDVEWVRLLQLGTSGAALWALGWLFGRRTLSIWLQRPLAPGQIRYRWAAAWHDGPDASLARDLLTVQVALVALGAAVLLVLAVGSLALSLPDPGRDSTAIPYAVSSAWTREAGTGLGWLALALAAAALFLTVHRTALTPAPCSLLGPHREIRSLSAHAVGLGVVAFFALLACSIEPSGRAGYGYRLLMLGWAASAFGWAAALAASALPHVRRWGRLVLGLSDVAPLWVAVGSVLSLLLGLKATLGHQDHLWAAVAIGMASFAGAAMAVQYRREDWALLAGFGVNFAASLLVWHLHLVWPLFDRVLTLLEANAAASATVALLWLWWRQQFYGPPELRLARVPLLAVQVALALLACLVFTVVPLLTLAAFPGAPWGPALAQVGDAGGWAALGLTMTAALWHLTRISLRRRIHVLTLALLLAALLTACTVHRWDTGNWLSYHTLLIGWSTIGLNLVGAGIALATVRWAGGLAEEELPHSGIRPVLANLSALFPAAAVRRWATGIGILVVLLALRGAWSDPQRPYWSVAATSSVSALAAALALWFSRAGHVLASGLLINLIGFLVWLTWDPPTVTDFAGMQVLCFGMAASFWALVELLLRSPFLAVDLRSAVLPLRLGASFLGLVLLATMTVFEVAANLDGTPATGLLAWAALTSLVVALALGLWDARSRLAPAGLYVASLLALGLVLGHLDVPPPRIAWLAWTACLLLLGYTLLVASVVWAAPELAGLRRALHLPVRREGTCLWLLPTEVVQAAIVLALSVWICQTSSFGAGPERLAAPASVFCLVAMVAFLAGRTSSPFPERWLVPHHTTVILSVVFLTELGWALLDPTVPAPWLDRSVLLMVALAVVAAACSLGLARCQLRWPHWSESGGRCGPVLGVLALLVLLGVLAQEFLLYDRAARRAPMAVWAVVVMVVALTGLMVANLRSALTPTSHTLALSQRRRTLHVYLAEVVLLGLFLHVRLTIPELFREHFIHYWPFLVMALAFVGVGLGEFFQRRGLPILAGPLYNTGIFIPVVPLLVFWVQPPLTVKEYLGDHIPGTQPLFKALDVLSTYQSTPSQFDRYALLWLLLGGLYALVAVARRSGRHTLLAVLAANVSLWCLLHHHGWTFLAHPQVWLIPLALIVLASEHLNRQRLGPVQGAALRQGGLWLLYLSSTAEMFITGLGHSVVLPVVLALLSVLGVLAGILLRVRAFLLLGFVFLGVVIFSMIWHAAVDLQQTWVWWASGIVLGLAILGLFALFEKRRNDMLRLVEEVRTWR